MATILTGALTIVALSPFVFRPVNGSDLIVEHMPSEIKTSELVG